jgi:outer membrane immunogenic protein
MKKLVLALVATAAITGSASAADLAARPYTKAPEMASPAWNWTGFYVFGGAGGGVWDARTSVVNTFTGACVLCGTSQRTGGDGWFGTVGGGYDWQFGGPWVAGIFADYQFGNMRGSVFDQNFFAAGDIKLRDAWAVGGRIGYLVAPSVLSYVNGGYTGSDWSGTTLRDTVFGLPIGAHTDGFSKGGWFIGGGVENSLNFFGIAAPGWFMKTEYRAAYYDTKRISERVDGTNVLVGNDISFRPLVQTISTSLVYRFNWGGAPVRY